MANFKFEWEPQAKKKVLQSKEVGAMVESKTDQVYQRAVSLSKHVNDFTHKTSQAKWNKDFQSPNHGGYSSGLVGAASYMAAYDNATDNVLAKALGGVAE